MHLTPALPDAVLALPKAELHLHLEGTIRPETAAQLARRHGDNVTPEEARARYQYRDFQGFLEAFKWVTSYLREPADYALVAERMVEELVTEKVFYAEVIVALGVMLWRGQAPEAIFRELRRVAESARAAGVRLAWAPDATRQFGGAAARSAAEWAVRLREYGVVAFGLGGDELAVPAREFRSAFDYAAEQGLRRTVHAGEIGGPEQVREAMELLHAERIGHGIAAMHDAALQRELRERRIALEICPWSNVRTGALERQMAAGQQECGRERELRPAGIEHHPLKLLFDGGVPVTLATDDPAMFHTCLRAEYEAALRLGLTPAQLADIAEAAIDFAFLPEGERQAMRGESGRQREALGLPRTGIISA